MIVLLMHDINVHDVIYSMFIATLALLLNNNKINFYFNAIH
jgi:hypothetical protein